MPIDLLTATKCSASLKKFIESDALYIALREVGTCELDAAINIANNIKHEKNKINTINRLLGHLESAYYNLCKSVNMRQAALRPDKHQNIVNQIRYVCAVAALCHKHLGSSNHIIEEWLIIKPKDGEDYYKKRKVALKNKYGEDLGDIFEVVGEFPLLYIGILNPLNFKSPDIEDVLTDKFIANIKKLPSSFPQDFDNL